MAETNFLRRYILKCGQMGKKAGGFQIGNFQDARQEALHISFSIEKSNAESPNDAKIQIWNLSDQNLRILETKDCVAELRAGYEDSMTLLIVGTITSVITTMENADRMTELTVVDGRVALRDTTISISLNGKVNTKEVYQRIAQAMGVSVVFAKDLSFGTIPNGFTYVGKAKNALQKIAKRCGHNWTIQNQVLQVTLPGRPVSTRGYYLSSGTGLLGIPKRVTIGSGKEAKSGWEVDYLLNGAIGINDVVCLNSRITDGYFLVQQVVMDGDNLEGDWICTAQLLKIKAEVKLEQKALSSKEEKKAKGKSGSASGGTSGNGGAIKAGDRVKLTRTLQQGGRTLGYQYSSGTFVCWYETYDVIKIEGDRAVIGKGKQVAAAVHVKDLKKV